MKDVHGECSDRNSDDIRDQAAGWVWRRQQQDWTEVDQSGLDAWLALSRHHLVAYWRLKAAWDRTERLAALRPSRTRPDPAPPARKWSAFRLASAVCAIVVLGGGAMYRSANHVVSYATAVGQRASIVLADGSQVQLNTNSAISADIGWFGRRVELSKGEAFFTVHHDASRPFVVLAAGHRITDLGTQFSVRTTDNRLEVALVEGRVRLASIGGKDRITDLSPGEIAVATANTLSISKYPRQTIANALAWREGKIVFSHVTLAQAAAEFNRYNRTKLVVTPSAANLKVSGTFDAGSIGPFTAMAKLAFGLEIEQRSHNIVVTRRDEHSAKHDD